MSDRLTLVVFKDHLSSRTLTMRLGWIRAFGLTLLSVIGLAILTSALFLNAYRKAARGPIGSVTRFEELEKELAETKAAYDSLKEQAVHAVSNGGGSALGGAGFSFSSLPSEAILQTLPPIESLPFRLEPVKAQWRGSTLQIRSAIEYVREDGGNQQGHFVILSRGPQSLLAYPDGAFNAANANALINPDAGEFFSVSRYREVKADLGPFARKSDVQAIDIYIFDQRKRLIFANRVGLESPTPPKAEPTSAGEPVTPRTPPPAIREHAVAPGPTANPLARPTITPSTPRPSPSPLKEDGEPS